MDQTVYDAIAVIVGAALSVLVEVPGVKPYFDAFSDGQKRLVMAALILAAGGLLFGATCISFFALLAPGFAVTCTQAGAAVVIRTVALILFGNQGVFGLAFKGRNK